MLESTNTEVSKRFSILQRYFFANLTAEPPYNQTMKASATADRTSVTFPSCTHVLYLFARTGEETHFRDMGFSFLGLHTGSHRPTLA